MNTTTLQKSTVNYSIDMIKDEAVQLLEKGVVTRYQPIYTLCQFIPAREWLCVERVLEAYDYLLRDQIADLIPVQVWEND